jgi:hypothetical protein
VTLTNLGAVSRWTQIIQVFPPSRGG